MTLLRSLGALALLMLAAAPAAAFPITIDPGAYAGRHIVGGTSFTGAVMLDLVAGTYFADTGAGVVTASSASYFEFTVDAAGQVTNVRNVITSAPSGAASAAGSTLTLNNVSVTVDPRFYGGGTS